MKLVIALIGAASLAAACTAPRAPVTAAPAAPVGEVKGSAVQHTAASAQGVLQRAAVVLPASVTGNAVYAGTFAGSPQVARVRVPVVVFLHGSSGLGLKAIGEWQQWLASQGFASIAPDSFALPDRLTYKSPVDREWYEKVHALRASEIVMAVRALDSAAWADTSRLVLAGTSEGATAVARHGGNEFAGRILYSWSCENNYFVKEHKTAVLPDKPVLNVMSATDVFFSPANTWLGNPQARGHCGEVFKDNKQASIVLIPGAPHTLMNLPPSRHATIGFLRDLLRP